MSPQQSIAHYRIVSKLGEGGMGEVWRATDTKLNRDVAIKVLPETLAQDPDRMARFQREAQVLASLNHPNIATIHGVEERALVMELVEGMTLAERIAQSPIPVDEALPIAKQIAEALEYAHDKNIIHRDLKPTNIKITPDGRVKVLDFGLAKALSPEATAPDAAISPTLTMRSTQMGVILGTAAYMSPEQARGQVVDRRADIWAFGVVLYEMLTGRALFAGPTTSDTLAAVLKTEPDLAAVPAELWPVVERCLRKDPRRRWQAIGDVRVALEEGAPAAPQTPPAFRSKAPWVWLTAAMMIAAVAAPLLVWRAMRAPEALSMRLTVDLGPDALVGANTTAVISPDGTRLVYPVRGPGGARVLATRLLDQTQVTLLPGTENAVNPFFSPDGREIGFFAIGSLKRVPVQGGNPVTICPAPREYGASWGDDGIIVLGRELMSPLFKVSADGGNSQPATKLASGEVTQRWPQILPGNETVLFTGSPSLVDYESSNIEAASLKTGETRILVRGGYYGRYLASGHLLFVRHGVLYAVAFSPARLEVQGRPVAVADDVADNAIEGGGQFDFSRNGTLVYTAGRGIPQKWPIVWMDSTGSFKPLLPATRSYLGTRFTPDGRRLAFFERSGHGFFVYDLERETTMQLSANSSTPGEIVWASDGRHIVFAAHAGNVWHLMWARSDGAEEAQTLLVSPASIVPWSITADGKHLAYFEFATDTMNDLWTVPLDASDPAHPKIGKPEIFLRTPANEVVPTFSPDGRWVAYRSNESGIDEVYVRPFPAGSGGKWPISSGGGLYGEWSPNGRELFYETADNRIMVRDYTVDGNAFVPGKPRLWTERRIFFPGLRNLALHPDGKRFAVFPLPEDAGGEKSRCA
jgi:serine/threonine-protein kinase